jgi:hypothetical protein
VVLEHSLRQLQGLICQPPRGRRKAPTVCWLSKLKF